MANDNNSWDVDDIDFSEIDFEDLDLDDLDFSVDGDLNSISEERPAGSRRDDLSSVAEERQPARPARPVRQPARPVRKVEKRDYDLDDDDDEDERPIRRASRQNNKQTSKAPFIIILCLIVALAVGAILFWLLRDSGDGDNNSGFSSSGDQTESMSESGTTAAWAMNTEEKVMDLVNSYYAARTLADVESLRNILDERIAINEDKVKAEARVVDSYQNINCYTTPGRNDGEFVTYISFDMKFKNINTPAPGLTPAYIAPDGSGNLRLQTWEYIKANDKSLEDFMNSKGSCDAIRELAESVETNFQNAKAQDPTLADFLDSLKKKETNEGGETAQTTESAAENTESGEDNVTEAPTTASDGGSEDTEHFSDLDTMMYAQENVKARVKPNTSDDTSFTLVKKGTYVQVTGSGTKWYRVCLKDGSTAYIMKQYLDDEKPAADAD